MKMNARLMWQGLGDLRLELRHLPQALHEEARTIVRDAGEQAATSMVQAYPRGATGNLRRGVTLQERDRGGLRVVWEVRSRAPHAYIYEEGTVPRRTKKGVPRGRMPAGHVFIPTMVRARRQMFDTLKALLREHGAARVVGDAAA